MFRSYGKAVGKEASRRDEPVGACYYRTQLSTHDNPKVRSVFGLSGWCFLRG